MAAEKTAGYKGRNYLVKWSGTTKTGKEMHKLAFLDGSKEFWCDSSLVTAPVASASAPAYSSGRRGGRRPCGYPGCTGYNYCDDCG